MIELPRSTLYYRPTAEGAAIGDAGRVDQEQESWAVPYIIRALGNALLAEVGIESAQRFADWLDANAPRLGINAIGPQTKARIAGA